MKTGQLVPAHCMRRDVRLTLALVTALFLIDPVAQGQEAGAPPRQPSSETVIGSGKLQTETRAINGFQAVALRGSMKLVLRQRQREAVEIRADDNLLPLIETRVTDRSGVPTLEIGGKPGTSYSARGEMTVTVDLRTLKALTISASGDAFCDGLKTEALKLVLSGSGDLLLRQLSADAVEIQASGSGDAEVAGRADRVDVAIAGSADVNVRGLQAGDVGVRITGSGGAGVNARRTLTVAIAGSGDVTQVGDAAVKSSITGSGRVTQR